MITLSKHLQISYSAVRLSCVTLSEYEGFYVSLYDLTLLNFICFTFTIGTAHVHYILRRTLNNGGGLEKQKTKYNKHLLTFKIQLTVVKSY